MTPRDEAIFIQLLQEGLTTDAIAAQLGIPLEVKDVVNLAFREFFERRWYLPEERNL